MLNPCPKLSNSKASAPRSGAGAERPAQSAGVLGELMSRSDGDGGSSDTSRLELLYTEDGVLEDVFNEFVLPNLLIT